MNISELSKEEKNALIWSTGITVNYGYAGSGRYGWWAYCTWTMGGHCASGCMEGELGTRYGEETLSKAVDYVLELVKRMNVIFVEVRGKEGFISYPEGQPELYYKDDGEGKNNSTIPENWKHILKKEAERIGFQSYRWCSCPGSCQGCYKEDKINV